MQSFRELEVLLALCKAAPALHNVEKAQKLVHQLSPYMVESFSQQFAPSPFLKDVSPSPWEHLTASLTLALISIGLKFTELKPEIREIFWSYTKRALAYSEGSGDEDNETNVASLVASFVGFLDSAAKNPRFWSSSEKLALLNRSRQILSDSFLMNAENSFTTIRNTQKKSSGLWKRYARRYDDSERPIGSLLLQFSFMEFLVSSTCTIVTGTVPNRNEDAMDILMDGHIVTTISPEDFSAVETYAEFASSTIEVIDNGASYWSTETDGMRRLARKVKALALAAYCNCVVLSNTADPNVLYKWLQDTISESTQMACFELASAALKIVAILAKDRNNSENGFISVLHHFIVEGGPTEDVLKIAVRCLSVILKHAPQDQTITTLNTLGHVLASTSPEKALSKSETLMPFDQQAMASSLSLSPATDDFRQAIYLNVIDTIVAVATHLKDPKVHFFFIRFIHGLGLTRIDVFFGD